MNAALLAKFQPKELEALKQLRELARDLGTAGGAVSAQVLLGLYNGERFPFDLTELRRLDAENLMAAITVIAMDASRCRAEVHVVLEALCQDPLMQARFEQWAFDLGLKGRATKAEVKELRDRLTGKAVRP